MKTMLFIAHRLPYPPNKGDKIRSYNELNFFCRYYTVDVLTFIDDPEDYQYVHELEKICRKVTIVQIKKVSSLIKCGWFFLSGRSFSLGYYAYRKAHQAARQLIKDNHYEVVFCFSSQMAQFADFATNCKWIMDFVDVDSNKWLLYSQKSFWPLSLVFKEEARRLLQYENKISKKFGMTLLSTENELSLFDRLAPDHGNCVVVNNGVDTEYFTPRPCRKENAIVFVGAMDYLPNVDGVIWFCNNVYPKVKEKIPAIVFYIVGRNPRKEVRDLAATYKDVIVTGSVDDVRPYLDKSRMAVIPLRIARGIQNKVLEAMAMAVPVVVPDAITKTLEGIDKSILFEFQDQECFVKQIVDNFFNDQLLHRNGAAQREYVTARMGWESKLEILAERIESLPQ